MTNEEIIKKIKKLEIGVWLSGITLLFAIINTVIRLMWPTFVVADPPRENRPYWKIGPSNMLTIENVAKIENTTSDKIISLIQDGKIYPNPLIIDEHNITWAIQTNYQILK